MRTIAEMMLAVLFLGVYSAVIASTWDGWLFFVGIVMPPLVLVPAYLVAVLMLRRHYEDRGQS